MKKIRQITLIITLLCIFAFSLLTSCSREVSKAIVTVGDRKLTLDDFIYDIYLLEAEGNSLNDYYYKNLGISYWDFERNGISMREAARDTILTRVIMYEILTDQAKKADFQLTDAELEANKAAVDTFISKTTEESLKKARLTKELLINAYNKFSLGDKYYLELSKDFNLDKEAITKNISPEEYREYRTECLYVPTVSTENQQITPLSEEEVTAAYSLLTNTLDKVKDGSDFEALGKENDKLTFYQRNFIINDEVPELEYRESAILLENGEYSDIVTTSFGLYIIHMLDNKSNARYEKAKEDAIKAEEKVQFESVYNEIKATYDIKINTDYWDTINIGFVTTGK